jgi:hypothetical protein
MAAGGKKGSDGRRMPTELLAAGCQQQSKARGKEWIIA